MNTDERLARTLRQLGDDVPVVDLAQRALRQSRRMRVQRRILGGGGAVLAVAALAVPFAFFSPDTASAPNALPPGATPPGGASVAPTGGTQPAPTGGTPAAPSTSTPAGTVPPGAVAAPGGWYVASASNGSSSWIYDPQRKAYRKVNYRGAWAAPDGRLVAVADGNGKLGILDPAAGRTHWITGSKLVVGRPEWSPDGKQLVFAGPGNSFGTMSIFVVSASNGQARKLRGDVECVELCQPTWLPGGTEVGLPPISGPRAGLQAYALSNGQPTRLLTLAGAVQSGHAWSPDGRFVVAESPDDQRMFAIGVVEAATGAVPARLAAKPDDELEARAAHWVTTDRLVVALNTEIVVFSPDGSERDRIALPRQLRGDRNQISLARG